MEQIPMPRGTWVAGHVDEFKRDRLGLLLRMSQLGPMSRARLLNRWLVLVNDPDLIKQLLVDNHKDLTKSYGLRVAAKPVLGEGLLRSEGDHWRRQRRIMASVFQPIHIDAFAHCMVDCALRGIDRWNDGEELDLVQELVRITLSIASKTLFGTESFDEAARIGDAVQAGQQWVSDRMATPVGMPLWIPTEMNKRFKAALRLFDEKMEAMIEARRGGEGNDDLLAKLLAARDDEDGRGMSDQQVKDEVMNLYVAGHETTSAGLAWAVHLLLEHPEPASRARAEVDALGDRRVSYEDVPKLRYTARVVKEALRLFPPAYIFGRTTTKPLRLGGHEIPAGVSVMVSPYALHRRPDFFPEPERFDPDRHVEEQEAKRPRYAYVPFGGGPRVCIGQHFATLEATLVLATLLQRIELRRAPGATVEPEPLVTLKPKSLRVVARRRGASA